MHPLVRQVTDALKASNPAEAREVILELAASFREDDPIRVALEPLQEQAHYLTHTPKTKRGDCRDCVEQFGAVPA